MFILQNIWNAPVSQARKLKALEGGSPNKNILCVDFAKGGVNTGGGMLPMGLPCKIHVDSEWTKVLKSTQKVTQMKK